MTTRLRRATLGLGTGSVVLAMAAATVAAPAAGAAGAARVATAKCSSPGVDATSIKVGVLFPQSGDVGVQFLNYGSGVKARLEAENARGGIGGRKLELVSKDDANEATRNQAVAKELVESDKVFGIIEASPRAPGSAAYLSAKGVPVTGWAINTPFGQYKSFFGYSGSTFADPKGAPTSGLVGFMQREGGKKLAVLGFANSPESATYTNNIAKAWEVVGKKRGAKTVYLTTDVPFGSSEFSADVQKIKDGGADALTAGITFTSFIALYQKAKEAGLDFKVVVGPTGYDDRLLALASRLQGIWLSTDFIPLESNPAPAQTFLDAMAKYVPDEKNVRSQLAIIGWLTADTFIRGLRAAGAKCPSRDAFVTKLRKVKDYDAGGFLPRPVDFTKLFGKPYPCTNLVQIQVVDGKGAFVPYEKNPVCGRILKG